MNRTYWLTWLALLGVTLVLILAGMTVKAGLITANFMHLRFERASLVATIAASTVFIVAFLYFLISIDGQWIKQSAVN